MLAGAIEIRAIAAPARRAAVSLGETVRFSKVPEVTLGFWLIKILATTLGETGGDAVTMSLNLGYGVGTMIFAGVFALFVAWQVGAKRFHPFLFWAVIVATTTLGTTLADFADRSLGIGYTGGSLLLLTLLVLTLGLWHRTLGSVSVATVVSPTAQAFYWTAILFSQTLGTALGDFAADAGGLGYERGALLFGAALALVALVFFTTRVSRVLLFWLAFILTRPLGATLGDWLDKPVAKGGLALDRFSASIVLALAMIALIIILPQRPEAVPGLDIRPGSREG